MAGTGLGFRTVSNTNSTERYMDVIDNHEDDALQQTKNNKTKCNSDEHLLDAGVR